MRGGALCRVFGRVTLAIFYKPLVPAMWYGVSHLLDDEGWMLHHNIFTDTLVAAVMALFSLWFAFAFAAALPVLVCFFYFPIALFVPVSAYILANKGVFFDEDGLGFNNWKREYDLKKMSGSEA